MAADRGLSEALSAALALMKPPSQAGLARVHEAMATRVEKRELPGIVTLIAHGDDVHVDTIGVTAFDGSEPMRRETLFRVASMNKAILAAIT